MTAILERSLEELFAEAEQDQTPDDTVQADVAYQRDPIGWLRDVLGLPEAALRWSLDPAYATHVWDGTPDPLARVCIALAAGESVGVESGTGTGKSYLAGGLILWFLACWEEARVFTFAPKEDQLRLFIWTEIGKMWPLFRRRFPTAELTDLRIRMRAGDDAEDAWGAVGYAVGVRAGEDVATKAAGMHAAHMLIVTEETPGINPAVMAAHENTCTAPHNLRLALGNPDHQLDTLHQFCTAPGVVHVRVSALDHPNVVRRDPDTIPGAVSWGAIERRRLKYGADSALYESRVRGISPAQATDSLIKLEWCEAAAARDPRPLRTGVRALGVDVANSEHGDKAAIARWDGATLTEVVAARCPDSNQLGLLVWAEIQRERIAPWYVGVDPIGVGAGTVNTLDAKAAGTGAVVQRLNGGASPQTSVARAPDGAPMDWVGDANLFVNLRAQMYWQLREDLRLGKVALPDDPHLFRELTTPTYKISGGKVVVEAKDDIRKRLGGASPDRADAVVYGNWVRRRFVDPKPPVAADPDRADRTAVKRAPAPARPAPAAPFRLPRPTTARSR